MNITAQGLGVGLVGVLAEAVSPSSVIVAAGAVSVPAALWPSVLWLKSTLAPAREEGLGGEVPNVAE
jgi:hypothetical protein